MVSQETAWQTVRVLVLKRQQEAWSRTDFLGVSNSPSVRLPRSGGKVHEELAVPGPLLGLQTLLTEPPPVLIRPCGRVEELGLGALG